MKRIFILILIPLLSLSLLAKVEMKFEKTTIDFGEVETGKIANVEFKFVNAGDETLKITKVETSCGCAAAKLDKMEFKPGEKGTLPVNFDSRGYNGPIIKTVTITTNDKDTPQTRLEIKGTVKLTQFADFEFALGSDRVDFKEVKIGQTYTEKIKIKNAGTIGLRITEICTSPEVNVLFPKKELNPKEEVELKIVFTPMQSGQFVQFLKISTNAYKQRMVIIKVSAEVK
jgi:hypothetical protein